MFTQENRFFIASLQQTITTYRHHSGAKILVCEADDPETLFCLSCSTPPNSDNGVPHILEHMVLCGSKRYKVRDPFFAMTRRSMSTFMNALTGPDFTCYPAASCSLEDLKGIFDVYCDAVFHPTLCDKTFLQEGWRLTPQGTLSGIVYNEMKGARQSATARLFQQLSTALFPNSSYRFDAGGAPHAIPQLSHAALKAYHATHYHPANTLFYFYGRPQPETWLTWLEEGPLHGVENGPKPPLRTHQPPLKAPSSLHIHYPQGAQEDPTYGAIGWMTGPADPKAQLALHLFESVYLDHDASPLKRLLLDNALAPHIETYLDDETIDTTFALFFHGCRNPKTLAQEVHALCQKALDAPLTTQTLQRSVAALENTWLDGEPTHYPSGLERFWETGLLWQQNSVWYPWCDPKKRVDYLHQLIQDPHKLQAWWRALLCDNPHHTCIIASPDAACSKREEEAEKNRTNNLLNQLSEEERAALATREQQLQAWQKGAEDLSSLPSVNIATLEKKVTTLPTITREKGTLFCHTAQKNYLYSSAYFPLEAHSTDLMIAAYCWSQCTIHGVDLKERLETIAATTGGMSLAPMTLTHSSGQQLSHWLVLSMRTPAHKGAAAHTVVEQQRNAFDWSDRSRLHELLEQYYQELYQEMHQNPLQCLMLEAYAYRSTSGVAKRALGGVPLLHRLRTLINTKDTFEQWCCTMEGQLRTILAQPYAMSWASHPDYFSCCPQTTICQPKWQHASYVNTPHPSPVRLAIPASVHFNVALWEGPQPTDRCCPAMTLAATRCAQHYLHTHLREQGGAYGYGCRYHEESQSLLMHSYRDPYWSETIAHFQKGCHFLLTPPTSQQLDEIKRCVLQKLEQPISSDLQHRRFWMLYQQGRTEAYLHERKAALIESTSESVVEAAAHWFQKPWLWHGTATQTSCEGAWETLYL